MLTTVEAEIEINGNVRLLEPVKISRKSRAIVTILDDENNAHSTNLSDEERRRALQSLMKHAGAVSGDNPNAGDNDRIDADLAREYGKDL